jgi:cytochrome c biogenesis protein ResB
LLKTVFFRIIKTLSRGEIFCSLLLIYIIILIIGTIIQKDFGIFFAQENYFNSNVIFFYNRIPFPGGKIILTLIFFSLLSRLITDKFKKKKIGTLFIHVGVLILLVSAFISSFFYQEGLMIIKEKTLNNFFTIRNAYEIIINDGNKKICLNLDKREINTKFKINDNIFFEIKKFYLNNNLLNKKKFLNKKEAHGINRFFTVIEYPIFLDQENNKLFIQIICNNKSKLIEFPLFKENNEIVLENNVLNISVTKKKEILPFDIYLIKFDKSVYPETNIAKNYKSKILINEKKTNWKTEIEMNKPFRFKNYTFYQSSFLDNGSEKATVLTVVKNFGNFLPYLSIIFITIGFIFHITFSINKLLRYQK